MWAEPNTEFVGYREGPPKLPPGINSPRWQPLKVGQPQARCTGHVFTAGERAEFVFDNGVPRPNPMRRTEIELRDGPLVAAHTMVDGQCRGCLERGMERGPVHADHREPAPPPTLFTPEATEPAPTVEELAEAHGFNFRTR